MTDLNPVSAFLRDYVAEHYARWRLQADEPVPTSAGLRYHSIDVATLFAPALSACGLRTYEEDVATLFVSASTGAQATRKRLRELLDEALVDHLDSVLRASVGAGRFWEHVADRTPYYEGEEIERVPRATTSTSSTARSSATRARQAEDEEASARAYLRELLETNPDGARVKAPDLYAGAREEIFRKVFDAADGYSSPFITDDEDSPRWRVPGQRIFYKVADDMLGKRRRNGRGFFFIIRRLSRRLSERARTVLKVCGVEDPEAYADATEARIGPPIFPANPDPELMAIVAALPDVIVYPVALAEGDGRRDFALMARFWMDRHPEAREPILAAARVFGADLVEHVRYRAATEIAERDAA